MIRRAGEVTCVDKLHCGTVPGRTLAKGNYVSEKILIKHEHSFLIQKNLLLKKIYSMDL